MRLAHRVGLPSSPASVERGAVIIELGFVALILIALLGAAFDFGMSWRAGLGVNEAARAGARVGSSQGDDTEADRSLLTGMISALASSGLLEDVQRVVIFDATSTTDGEIPAGCVTGTSGPCNILTGDQFRAVTATSPLNGTGCIMASLKRSFCPETRNEIQLTASSLGVWVRVRYQPLFPSIPTMDIDRTAVMRLEPEDD